MEKFINVIYWVIDNKETIINAVAYAIASASIIVKLTPTLKDDNVLKGIIKFLGKFVALDKYGPNGQA